MQNGAFREADEAKRKFKEIINKEKQEFNIKLHEKENEYWYEKYPELRELTDDPSSCVMENQEWFYKVYFSNLKPQEPIRAEGLPF